MNAVGACSPPWILARPMTLPSFRGGPILLLGPQNRHARGLPQRAVAHPIGLWLGFVRCPRKREELRDMNAFSQAIDELLGRASGPMHFRLIMQPLMACIFAVRAGLRDARQNESPFLWTFLNVPGERKRLLKTVWKDVGKIFILAIVLDTIYQVIALHQF